MLHTVVGYGTLLNVASASQTLGSALQDKIYRPVVVQGYRRLFNLRPDHYAPSNKTDSWAEEAAAMNIEPAPGLAFNGVVFDVSESELQKLDERERYYRRVRVEIVEFATGAALPDAQVYAAEPTARWICRDPERLLPRWQDIELARSGAYGISQGFGEMFDQTTYLADGSTLMVSRYANDLSDFTAD